MKAPQAASLAWPQGGQVKVRAWAVDGGVAVSLRRQAAAAAPPALEDAGAQALQKLLWPSALPATLQDDHHRLAAVNDAYLHFTGRRREALLGTDPIAMAPLEDHEEIQLRRLDVQTAGSSQEQRIVDASGRERWARVVRYAVPGQDGQRWWLSVLQDTTAEHLAQAQAERSLSELAQWFDLSPVGMLVFDAAGLLVRSNPAFEALVGKVPVLLSDASPEVQALLGWVRDHPADSLHPNEPPLETHATVPLPDGQRRRLSARVRGYETDSGQRRFMAVVEDRSAEEERDLVRQEIGALMDTAGVGVATFDKNRGWLRGDQGRRNSAARARGPAVHQSRDRGR